MSKRYLFILLIYIPFFAGAQMNDAGLWTSVTLQKNLKGPYKLELSHEVRLNENYSEVGTSFTQAGIEYKVFKGFTASMNYRFTQKRRLDDSYSSRHRIFVDLSYRKKYGIVALILRERIQSQLADVHSSEDGWDQQYHLRSKLSAKFDLKKKYTPFFSTEIFYQLNNAKGNEIDGMRYAAGVDYDFNKKHAVSFFYLLDQELHSSDAVNSYITGIGYTYSY